jgi:vitamin B12 transporter
MKPKMIRLSTTYIRNSFCFLLAIVFGVPLFAQVTISGRVKDAKGKPVIGASISIRNSYDGATADSSGKFSFRTTEKGKLVLEITSIGYKPVNQDIVVETQPLDLSITLKEEPNELKAVVISAGTFEASDKKKATVLNPIDIVTTASANGDVTGALKTLPGAQQVGETEGLFVRGGTAGETKTFIDGTLVNNFFYSSIPNVATRGRFSPFIFKGTVFSTGGYSALYGQALSSALILESIDLPDQSSANLGVSVIGVSAGFQSLSKDKKSSWGFNYAYTNLALAFKVIKQQQDFTDVPVYHTADANFRVKTSKTGMLKYYGTFGANKLRFTTNSIDTLGYKDAFGLKNINHYHNLSWKESLGRKWRMNAGVSYTNNRDDINSNLADGGKQEVLLGGLEFKNFGLVSRGNFFNAKLVIEKKLYGLSAIRFGTEYNYSKEQVNFTNYNGATFISRVNEQIKSGFAEADVYLTNNLAAKMGARVEHSSLLGKVNAAPRLSLAYKVGKESQASLAYGMFYQNPERRYLPSTAALDFSRADHYIAQYQLVNTLQTFRAELFYKKYHGLVKTGVGETALNNNGFGDAKGFEIFWRDKKTIKELDYWISYSYLDTKRDFLNFPTAIQPNFAAKHTASVVTKKFVTKWKTGFNLAYNFATGRPYYRIVPDGSQFKFADRGRTPEYHNVSFSLNYLPKIGKPNAKMFAVYVLSVSNIFAIRQVYGYNYSYNNLRKEAIVPPSRVFVFMGAFLSFGVDRSQDVINSNL